MNTFFYDLLKESINDNQNQEDDMSHPDALIYNWLLKSDLSYLDHKRKSISWQFTKQLLQEQHNSLRTKLILAMHNPIVAAFYPSYALSPERRFMHRTQADTTLAYSKALQQIQGQTSFLNTQLKTINSAVSSPITTQLLYTSPLMINIQHDTALDKDDYKNGKSFPDPNTTIHNQRDPTHSFPCRLHEILSNPEYSECITWLPHGRSWKVLRRSQFESLVIPRHFRHGRYSSFMRQVNGWRFQRITEGPDHNSYFHPQFMRDSPQLCWTMRRPLSLDTPQSHILLP